MGKDTWGGHRQTGGVESKAKLSKSFPDLQNGRHGLVGADCRFLVGGGLGRVDGISIKRNPYFLEVDKCHQTSSFPQHDHHQIVAFSFSRQPTNSFKIILVPCQGGLLWRLAWYLRFFLPNYYGEHTHGEEKNQIWLFLAARYIFPIALEAQLWRGGDDGKHGRLQVI